MTKYRSILAVVFAIITVFVVGCSSPAPTKKLTYTPEQISAIQSTASDLTQMRDRLPELQNLIQQEDWIFARNFIHGPLGEIRVKMSQVARDLLPDSQKQARQLAKEVANDLVDIDQAAASTNYKDAVRYYGETIKDLDAFFNLLPQG